VAAPIVQKVLAAYFEKHRAETEAADGEAEASGAEDESVPAPSNDSTPEADDGGSRFTRIESQASESVALAAGEPQ
jgi:hypothetical protein